LVCLTNLLTRYPPMPPKLNRKRALFVLTKIDEILVWEKQKEAERDTRFVDLARYLCEVRAGQCWRLEDLKSFDEFLARRFPESRRKAYYLMSIREHLPPQARKELKEVGCTKGLELAQVARRDCQQSIMQPGCTGCVTCRKRFSGGRWRRRIGGAGPFLDPQEPDSSDRTGDRKRRANAWNQQIARLLLDMICTDFLTGAHLDSNPEILLSSISRYYKFLRVEQQRAFLENLRQEVS
jgi:hypothetical protein